MRFKIQNLTLSRKLVLLVYSCIAGIYIVVSIFWFIISELNAREESINQGFEMCASGNQLVDRECSYLMGISDYLAVSSKAQEMLRYGKGTDSADSVAGELKNLKYAVSLVLYDLEGSPVDFMSIDNSNTPVAQKTDADTPFGRVVGEQAAYEWELIEQGSKRLFALDNSPKLCLWRLITDQRTARPLGVMAIAVDPRRFISISSSRNSLYFNLILLDLKTGQIASNHTAYALDAGICQTLADMSLKKTRGQSSLEYDGIQYDVFFARANIGSLMSVYLTPRRLLVQDLEFFRNYVLLVLLCISFALIPLLLYATNRLTLPLRRLADTLETVSQGNLNASFSYTGEDEIGTLSRAFNEMVVKIRTMMQNTIDLQVREQEAELATLQAQINPHFLYNMLNMIYWRALRSGNEDLADISYAMGQLFRMTLKRGRSMITLREEFEICRYYLMLQKKRYGDHIEYAIQVEAGLEDVLVPKLLLQPLVENAIVHGAENYDDVVNIRLTASRMGEQVRFQVINDGKIIPPEILRTLPESAGSAPTHRLGNRYALRNISDRLKLLFGEVYSFTFESSPETGTVVTICYSINTLDNKAREEMNNAQSTDRR